MTYTYRAQDACGSRRGSVAGYARHQAKRQVACPECRAAHTAYRAAQRDEHRTWHRLYQRAKTRAYLELVRRHRYEFHRILDAKRREVIAEEYTP